MDKIIEKAKLLIAIGTKVKPSVELERLTSKALKDLAIAVVNYEQGTNSSFLMTEKELSRVLEVSKTHCIRDILL